MNLSCSSKMIKYLMFAFNLFFVISGVIIIAVGATVKTVYSEYSEFLDSKYFTLPNMLIATGAFIFLVSFFGCCGAIKESWVMLGVFSIFLCIIFVFEFSAGIAGYVLRDKTISYLDTTLRNNINTYNSTHIIWDSIQSGFHCCGVDGYEDWSNTFADPYDLPISCCPAKSGTSGKFYCNSFKNVTTLTSEGTTSSTITSSSETPASETPSSESPATNSTTESSVPTSNETASTASTLPGPGDESLRHIRAVEDTSISENVTTTTPIPSTTGPYTTGCTSAFGQYVKKHAVQIGGCALGLAIVQVLGIAFSCHLVRQLKNGYYST